MKIRDTDRGLIGWVVGVHQPLPRAFYWWVMGLGFLALLLWGLSLRLMIERGDLGGSMAELNPRTETARPPVGGLFAVFYRGTGRQVPWKAGMLNGPISYRTEVEFGEGFPAENSSALISGWILVQRAGKYKFMVDANDSAVITVNGQTIFNDPNAHAIRKPAGELALPAGRVPVVLEWSNRQGNGWLGLWWESPELDIPAQFIPAAQLIPDPGAGVKR